MNSYKELIVWQKSIKVVSMVYDVTIRFPTSEQFGLVSQIRRSAISIPSNIAELEHLFSDFLEIEKMLKALIRSLKH